MPAAILTAETDLAPVVRSMQRIAVLGIKDDRDPDQPAYSVPATLVDLGKEVIGVSPVYAETFGRKNLSSLAEIPAGLDGVVIFRRSDAIPGIANELIALPSAQRPRVVWLQSGIRHDEAAERLVQEGFTVVQDRCIGVYAHRYK
jgi:predicted CoA-binding protein